MITFMIVTVLIIFSTVLITKRFKSRIIFFQGKKFIVPFKDRNCSVIHFDGIGTFRNTKGKWLAENHFNLAEWTWADKFDKYLIFNVFVNYYLRITNPFIIGALAFLYILVVNFTSIFITETLVTNFLQVIIGFWVVVGIAVLLREFIIKKCRFNSSTLKV